MQMIQMATIMYIVLRFPEWSEGLSGWQIAVYLNIISIVRYVLEMLTKNDGTNI